MFRSRAMVLEWALTWTLWTSLYMTLTRRYVSAELLGNVDGSILMEQDALLDLFGGEVHHGLAWR